MPSIRPHAAPEAAPRGPGSTKSTSGRSVGAGSSRLRRLAAVVALVVVVLAAVVSSARGPLAAQPERELGVIVVLEPGADPAAEARAANVRPTHLYRNVFRGFAGRVPERALAGLRRNPRVALVSEDRPVAIVAQVLPAGVDRVDADVYAGAAIDGNPAPPVPADVAVLDTGIDLDHPDLDVVGGTDCTGLGAFDDDHGHGTHVAGTVAALDNGLGVVGVAPGASLWAVKVLAANGGGSWSSVVCGLDWVHANRGTIDAVNMSLGGGGADGACADDALHRAICNVVGAGVPVVAAAGNAGQDAGGFVPATYEQVIAVSAYADFDGRPGGAAAARCDHADDTFASFSNHGADVDVAAPGVCVRSTVVGGGTGGMSGTSMAAPHVAGGVALYKAANPDAGPAAVRQWLLETAAEPQGSEFGFGGDPDGVPEPVFKLDGGEAAAAEPAPSSAPDAQDDAYRVKEDTALRRAAPGVLANDADPDGGALTVRVVVKPTKGSLTFNADGSFVYKPKRNFSGTDRFTYEVKDGQGLTDTAKVTIRVRSQPD